jgi:hypothetical protein
MCIKEPIIGEKALFYYNSALSPDKYLYEKAFNLRLCLEKLIDSIIYPILFSESDKEKYYKKKNGDIRRDDNPIKVDLIQRIDILKQYLDSEYIIKLTSIRLIGNAGVHDGIDSEISKKDVDELFEVIYEFPIKLFSALFRKTGFYSENSWTLTVLSVLPPYYRIKILSEYFLENKSFTVIEKLSMAYLKNNNEDKAFELLVDSLNNECITYKEYKYLVEGINLLKPNLEKFRIAKSLNDSKNLLKELLQYIKLEERNFCVDLISIICDIDIFNDERIIKNNNEFISFKTAIKVQGKDDRYSTNIIISRRVASKLNINKFDILSDRINNIYKEIDIEEDYLMPYNEQDGEIIDICISPSFISDNVENFRKIILNESARAKECYLVDGKTGFKYNDKILVFNLEVRRNS